MSAYIIFASWEDRFIESAKNDMSHGVDSIYCFYFENEKFYNRTKKNIDTLESLSKNKNIEFKSIALKFDEYIISWKAIKTTFETIQFNGITKLNISTMPRNMIFCMLYHLKDEEYEVLYYPAKKHSATLTTNPSTPHIVLRHGGIMYPNKKTRLIVFVGYDRERVYQLYNYFEPYQITLIKVEGNAHYTPQPTDYQDSFSDIPDLEEIKIDVPSCEAAFNKLNDILPTEELEKYNILVCSLGPKIQAIGIYKFHQIHNEIALLYAPSKDYSDDYSTGIKLEDVEQTTSDWINGGE